MATTVVVKQGAPSKPGERVDTSQAKVVEEKAAVAQAADEGKSVERKTDIANKAQGMVPKVGTDGKPTTTGEKLSHPARARDAAVKAVTGKGGKKPAAKKPTGKGKAKGPVARLTETWASAKSKDVKVKDVVKMKDGTVIEVIGRWTKKTVKGNVPMVTGRITAGAPDGKKKGDRHNAVAAEVTHTK